MVFYSRISLLFAFLVFFTACSSTDKVDTATAEGAFKLAEKYEKDERFDEAITYYSDVKNKFPYSSLATSAELKIADIEFKRENFPEAESAYKVFREFHPTHEKSDYAIYRLGLSIFNQLPPTTDRDLSLATAAIENFDVVINSYSASPYVKEAQEKKRAAQQMLADKEYYIANFYFIREKWESSLGRFEDLLRNHSKFGYDEKALYGATLSAYRMKDMDKAKSYFKRLLADFPNSKELAQARTELSDGF
jgi:outer membrane protein assembly factor BamD